MMFEIHQTWKGTEGKTITVRPGLGGGARKGRSGGDWAGDGGEEIG